MYELTKEYLQVVKLTGPGLGNKASGTLAGQLTFSNWKGKAYLKKHTKPKQPRTNKQLSMRYVMAFLSQQWSSISPPNQATWIDLAAQTQISAFNAFQKYNLQRWRNFQPPSQIYPATEAGTDAVVMTYGRLCSGNHATLQLRFGAQNDGWALALFAKQNWPYPYEWYYLISMQLMVPNAWNNFNFYPTEAGSWHFTAYPITRDGKFHSGSPFILDWCALTP